MDEKINEVVEKLRQYVKVPFWVQTKVPLVIEFLVFSRSIYVAIDPIAVEQKDAEMLALMIKYELKSNITAQVFTGG